jgi:glycosyltransferase involved in cell wall biosynthesis
MNNDRQATVSLCMIVRDEAHQLDDCLAPVADLFDEIVIVDTGSRDDTRRIAERYTPHVFDFSWCDDFAAARNHSLLHAQGDWIFWLDADDRVPPASVSRLRHLFDSLSVAPQAFVLDTVLLQDDQARDRERLTSHLRLFRRHPDLRWHGRVHEAIKPWPTAIGYEVLFRDIRIDHLGYRDELLVQRKLRRNVRLLQMQYALTPNDPAVLVDLASAFAQLGKSAEARRHLRAVLSQRLPPRLLLRRAFTTLGEVEMTEANFTVAAGLLGQALRLFPDDEYLLYMHSEALFNLGDYRQAQAALLEIVNGRPQAQGFRIGTPADLRQRLAPLALGEVLRSQLALREAKEILFQVARDFPHDPSAWYLLGRVYTDWRDWASVDEMKARLKDCPQGDFYAGLLETWGEVAEGRWHAAETILDRLIAHAPRMPLLRLVRAECLHRRGAPAAAQMQACRDLQRLQPHNPRARDILARLNESSGAAMNALSSCTSIVLGAGVGERTLA